MDPIHTNSKDCACHSTHGTFLLVAVLLSSTPLAALGTPPPTGIAPVIAPTGGFAIEGDLLANAPLAGTGDWLLGTNVGGGGAVLNAAGQPLNSATTFHYIDPFTSDDSVFSGGLKWTDNPNTWQWSTGKASGKTDINNVLLHVASDTNSHTWTVIAADRLSTSGDSYIDFEFLQNTLVKNANGTFTSAGPNGGRTTNDLLLSLAFTNGGNSADFYAWRWQADGNGGFAYVDATASLPAGRVFAAMNTNTVSVPYGAFGQNTYVPNAFAEAALDLTAMLGGFDPCLSFGFKTILVKTKTSQSSTATISDFVEPIQYTLRIGPSADAGPDQRRCWEGDSTAFPLHGVANAGLQPIASTAWSIVAGTAVIDSPASLITTAHVFSASATLRLTVLQSNGCTETNDVVLNVAPLPVGAITGPALVCPQSRTLFHGPPGMTAYSWSVTGNGAIAGATNAQNVTVTAGSACGSNFTLVLNITSNACSSPCTTDVLVNDTTPPTLSCPADLTLECPADTRTNATGIAAALDDCGLVNVSYSDSVSNSCGGTRIIARTWTAVDQCGNGTNAVQTITVRDTTPPALILPANLALECPAVTTTNATGVATARDGCGTVTVSYSDSVSNGCGGASVITRTWTAVDQCGNGTNAIQTISVRDTTPPTLIAPENLVLECPAVTTTNVTGAATAQDGCGTATVSYSDSVSNSCGGASIIARTWTAVDQCGNRTNIIQTITVRDTTPPSLGVPVDLVLECPAVTTTNATGTASAEDGCGTATVSYSDSVSNSCGGTRVIARTWTALDQCGNRTNAIQTITVRDTAPPVLAVPPDLVLECPAVTTTNATGTATALDGCGTVTISYSDSISNSCGGTRVIARTWTALDRCGNGTNAIQTITVRDTAPPVLAVPPDRVLECPAVTTTNATGAATALDGCGTVTVSYSDSVSNSCGGTRVIARTWTAVDQCGNGTNAVQTITVRDTTPPTLTLPANLVLECPAVTTTNATGVATAQDGCGTVAVSYSDSVSNSCGGTKIIARTWTAVDQCGNGTNAIQTIAVRDITPPSLTLPANLVLECPAVTTTNATGIATALDGCGTVAVSYRDSISNNCGGTRIIARTWTAVDQCGNATNAVQTITVRDTTPPTLLTPADLVLECPAATTTNVTGVATAQDGCGTVTVRYSDSVSNSCGGTRIISRTWTAQDQCGNATNVVQTITVRDTTPPTLVTPADLVLECPAVTTTNVTGVATAQDGCGTVTISYSDSVSNSCGGTRVIARTWTALDQCGNRTRAIQTITVRDTIRPTISCPADVVVECGASTSPTATGTATAQDGCGSVSVTYSDVTTNTCGGSRIIARTWTAADACGNATNALQTITVRDTTPPALRLPANLVLECPADTRTNVTGVAIAVDACGAATVTYSDVVSNSCSSTRIIWRTWTATDGCGNSTNGSQTITVQDTTKPSISCPNVSVQCPADVPAPYADLAAFLAAGGRATDSCSQVLTFSLTSDTGLVGSCPGRVTRVYRVIDACGNFADGTQTITVDDTIPPTLTRPTNLTVECGVSLDPANTGRATAIDNCDTNVSITYADALMQGQYDLKFLVADPDSGTGPYLPTYHEFGPGSLPCPDLARLTGRALDPLRNAVAFAPSGQLDALTSIGNVPMAFGQIVPFEVVIQASGGPGPERGTIEFTAAWNTYTTSNNRFGYDTNYMVYCAFVDAADPGSVDPNNNARVESYRSTVVNPGTISEAIQGTFRVSGLDSGDRVVVEIWVVLDSAMPEHTGGTVAATLVSAQKASNPPVPITVGVQTDSLGNLSKITALPPPQEQPPLGPLPPQPPVLPGAIISVVDRTWTATDACGNQSTGMQEITVRDTTPPNLILSTNVVLECPAPDTSTNVTGSPVIQEACGSVKVYYSDLVSNSCAGTRTIIRTWTATDDSGNSTNVAQTITVRDSAPPALTLPDNLALECPAVTTTNVTGVATALDGCGTVTISYSDSISNSCGGTRVIARTWTAVDQCGNGTNAVQTITVRDTSPPILTLPANLALECPAVTTTNATGVATALDGCGTVAVSYSDSISNSCGGTRVIARTWTAVDQCGNGTNAVQTITVRDTSPPTLTLPANLALECPAVTTTNVTGAATALDGCGTVAVSYSDSVSNSCAGTRIIARTWTAVDQCGNGTNAIQTITVRDTSPPNLTLPANLVLECPAVTTTNVTGVATALDACGSATVSYSDSISNSCGGASVISRTWTAVDQCGNGTNAIQTITVRDVTPPTLTGQPDRIVVVGEPWSFDTPLATDLCSAATVSVLDTVTNVTGAGTFVATRTWAAVDACGNSNSTQQTVTVLSPPLLQVLHIGTQRLMLRWPLLPVGFLPESSDNVTPPVWYRMSEPCVATNGFNCVEFTPTAEQKLFRLVRPTP